MIARLDSMFGMRDFDARLSLYSRIDIVMWSSLCARYSRNVRWIVMWKRRHIIEKDSISLRLRDHSPQAQAYRLAYVTFVPCPMRQTRAVRHATTMDNHPCAYSLSRLSFVHHQPPCPYAMVMNYPYGVSVLWLPCRIISTHRSSGHTQPNNPTAICTPQQRAFTTRGCCVRCVFCYKSWVHTLTHFAMQVLIASGVEVESAVRFVWVCLYIVLCSTVWTGNTNEDDDDGVFCAVWTGPILEISVPIAHIFLHLSNYILSVFIFRSTCWIKLYFYIQFHTYH